MQEDKEMMMYQQTSCQEHVQEKIQFIKQDKVGVPLLPFQEREFVNDYTKYPYNSIGKIVCSFTNEKIQKQKLTARKEEQSFGTAVIVGQRLIMTSAHVVLHKQLILTQDVKDNYKEYSIKAYTYDDIKFYLGNNKNPIRVKKQCWVHPQYCNQLNRKNSKYDVALLELQPSPIIRPDQKIIRMKFDYSFMNYKEYMINITGYPDSGLVQRKSQRQAQGQKNDVLQYKHTTFGGNSGGPLLLKLRENEYQMIGVHKAGKAGQMNYGILFNRFTRRQPRNPKMSQPIKQFLLKNGFIQTPTQILQQKLKESQKKLQQMSKIQEQNKILKQKIKQLQKKISLLEINKNNYQNLGFKIQGKLSSQEIKVQNKEQKKNKQDKVSSENTQKKQNNSMKWKSSFDQNGEIDFGLNRVYSQQQPSDQVNNPTSQQKQDQIANNQNYIVSVSKLIMKSSNSSKKSQKNPQQHQDQDQDQDKLFSKSQKQHIQLYIKKCQQLLEQTQINKYKQNHQKIFLFVMNYISNLNQNQNQSYGTKGFVSDYYSQISTAKNHNRWKQLLGKLQKLIKLNGLGHILSIANVQLNTKQFLINDYYHIQILCLTKTGIDDKKFQQIIQNSDKFCNVKFLQLDNNQITIIIKEDLLKLRQIQYLDLSQNQLTEQAIDQLHGYKQKHANVIVYYSVGKKRFRLK